MPARRREPLARELPAELQVAATNGSILTDSRGRKYIDFVMGWCVGNFGWRPAATAKAIERFKGPDYVYPGLVCAVDGTRAAARVAGPPGWRRSAR
jgi:4-aminobutyrate aminotransferase-like enzyme